MIILNIEGRVKEKKRLTQFADDVIRHLMPRIRRDVNVDIAIVTHCDGGNLGLCWGDKKTAEIEICRKHGKHHLSADEIALNLAHELVHAKQFIKGELHPSTETWCRQDHTQTPYRKKPWEVEAYRLEEKLVEMFW